MLDFTIKICGITNPTDAIHAANSGAGAIGLNFYHRSLRSVNTEQARSIASSTPSGINKVGVFVNHSAGEIKTIAEQVGLDTIQLHGDESPEIVSRLSNLPVIRMLRAGEDHRKTEEDIETWEKVGAIAVLLDAVVPGQYGGTGVVVDWEKLSRISSVLPIILAGGLTADNVQEAIQTAKPSAVDVASGVEDFPGKKNPVEVEKFATRAAAAFQGL